MLLFLGLFYLSLYLPLTALVYLPGWYELNCHWHPRCEILGAGRVEQAVDELTRYFRHQGELVHGWSQKERRHLAEVRPIYDGLFLGAFLAAAALVLGWEPRHAARTALWAAAGVAALALVLPFFAAFWTQLFHALLFDNELWRNDRGDLSWYFMPREFFKYSAILLISAAVAINLILAWALRGRA